MSLAIYRIIACLRVYIVNCSQRVVQGVSVTVDRLKNKIHKIQILSGCVNTNIARLLREALQAHVCGYAKRYKTFLS